jgi:hypothetical protein
MKTVAGLFAENTRILETGGTEVSPSPLPLFPPVRPG